MFDLENGNWRNSEVARLLMEKLEATAAMDEDEPKSEGHRFRKMMGVEVCSECGLQKKPGEDLYRVIDEKGVAGPWMEHAPPCEKEGVVEVSKPETEIHDVKIETVMKPRYIYEEGPDWDEEEYQRQQKKSYIVENSIKVKGKDLSAIEHEFALAQVRIKLAEFAHEEAVNGNIKAAWLIERTLQELADLDK